MSNVTKKLPYNNKKVPSAGKKMQCGNVKWNAFYIYARGLLNSYNCIAQGIQYVTVKARSYNLLCMVENLNIAEL